MSICRRLAASLLVITAVAAPAVRAQQPSDASAGYRLADQALHDLVSTPLGKTLPNLPWKVEIIDSWRVNASSNGRGNIAITRGLAWVLGDHVGVWAAAIAHELGHAVILYTGNQPAFEAELRRAYAASGGDPNDPAAKETLSVTSYSGGLLNLGGQRRIEYEADRIGVLLMAEAGFHPDYAIALDRGMRSLMGDQTKYAQFLLTHPLWSAREEETLQEEKVALAIFNQFWPNAAKSPGGAAPPIGSIQSVTVSDDPQTPGLILHISGQIRNARTRHVRIAAILLDHRHKVRAAMRRYEAPDGSFAANAMLPPLDRGKIDADIHIPTAAMDTAERRLKAVIFLVADDWTISIYFRPVELPSPRAR